MFHTWHRSEQTKANVSISHTWPAQDARKVQQVQDEGAEKLEWLGSNKNRGTNKTQQTIGSRWKLRLLEEQLAEKLQNEETPLSCAEEAWHCNRESLGSGFGLGICRSRMISTYWESYFKAASCFCHFNRIKAHFQQVANRFQHLSGGLEESHHQGQVQDPRHRV